MYGTKRLEQMVARMASAMNTEEIIEAILGDVTDFEELPNNTMI